MTASYLRESASFFAVSGISKAPGTRMIVTASDAAPLRSSASRAPASRRSEMNALKRLTTTANRLPRASRFPWIVFGIRGGGSGRKRDPRILARPIRPTQASVHSVAGRRADPPSKPVAQEPEEIRHRPAARVHRLVEPAGKLLRRHPVHQDSIDTRDRLVRNHDEVARHASGQCRLEVPSRQE